MAKTKFAPFNAADYLDNEEVIAEYLAAALEDPDPEVFMMAVSNVAKVRGIAKIAKDSGLDARACTRRWRRAPNRGSKPCESWWTRWVFGGPLRLQQDQGGGARASMTHP